MNRLGLVAIPLALGLAACGAVNNSLARKTKTVEYYRIFDIKTKADRQTVSDAASNGLGRNINDAREATPIPSFSTPPDAPGRFKLVNPLEGTNMAAFASAGGSVGFKIATCEGAVWTANANRDVQGATHLNLTACLYQYKGGYHLDLYAVFMKQEGGFAQVSRALAGALAGSPEEWTEKTFLDVVRNIRKVTGAEVQFLEGVPKLQGTPWLDEVTASR